MEARQLMTPEIVVVQNKEFGPVTVESILTITPSTHKMTIECVAQNLFGKDSDAFPIDPIGKNERFNIQLHCIISDFRPGSV